MELREGFPNYLAFDKSILPQKGELNKWENNSSVPTQWMSSGGLLYDGQLYKMEHTIIKDDDEIALWQARGEVEFLNSGELPWPYIEDFEFSHYEEGSLFYRLTYEPRPIKSPRHEFKCLLVHLINKFYKYDDSLNHPYFYVKCELDEQLNQFQRDASEFIEFLSSYPDVTIDEILWSANYEIGLIDPFCKDSPKWSEYLNKIASALGLSAEQSTDVQFQTNNESDSLDSEIFELYFETVTKCVDIWVKEEKARFSSNVDKHVCNRDNEKIIDVPVLKRLRWRRSAKSLLDAFIQLESFSPGLGSSIDIAKALKSTFDCFDNYDDANLAAEFRRVKELRPKRERIDLNFTE